MSELVSLMKITEDKSVLFYSIMELKTSKSSIFFYFINTKLFRKHDRIAQVIIEKIEPTEIIQVDTLEETLRGEGGFGSTGVEKENFNPEQVQTN